MSRIPYRIDVHHHIVPQEYLESLASIGINSSGGVDFPQWSAEATLARMDENRSMLGAARSPAFFDEVRKKYDDMRLCLQRGVLGGALHSYMLAS